MRTPEQSRPLTPPNLDKDRAALLDWVRATPLVYGRDSWRSFKALYKYAEPDRDPELLGALIARIDDLSFANPEPSAARQGSSGTPDCLVANRDLLLMNFGNYYRQRLEARLVPQPLSPGEMNDARGKSAAKIAWLGNRRYAVLVNISGRSQGVINAISFENPAQAKQVATFVIDVPISVAATETHAFVLVHKASAQRGAQTPIQGVVQYIQRVTNPAPPGKPTALCVFDLTDPHEPTQVAMLDIPDAVGMSLHGSRLAIATTASGGQWLPGQLTGRTAAGGLEILDVSQPSAPRSIGRLSTETPDAVALTEHRAFVLTRTPARSNKSVITVIDLSDPARPRPRGVCELPGTALLTLAARGDQVYALSGYPFQLHCIDCTDPAKPVLLHDLDILARYQYSSGDADVHGAQVYVATGHGIVAFDMTDPKHPFRLGDPPSVKTVGYMKRRARRALRLLASSDSAAYVETAFAVLIAPSAQNESLDLATQWAAHDVLCGAGSRFEQAHHGRGTLIARDKRLPRRPEYRAPDAWHARPDLAARLYAGPNRPWQVYDAALKMLRAARVPVPPVTEENLARFLRSESPLLIREATRSVVERVAAGGISEAVLIADSWYLGNAAVRRALAARIGTVMTDTRQAPGFAARLFDRATENLSSGAFSRRRESTLTLLAARFPNALFGKTALPVLGALLTSNREEIIAWTLSAFSRSSTDLTPDWIAALESVEPAMRRRALEALLAAMQGRAVDGVRARALVYADSAWKREAGWKALEASLTPDAIFRALWDELFSAPDDSEALATALSSPAALATLRRTDYTPDEILSRLQSRPSLARLLAPEAFATFALSLPPRALLPLLATVGDDSWRALRPGLLAALQDPARSLAFWQAAWTTLPEQNDTVLQSRILDDGPISETFLLTRGPEFLNTSAAILGPLLARWARTHRDLFPRGSAELLNAATHALPEVRAWGLEHALSLGLDLPFALRLLESELPAPVNLGKMFFDAAPTDQALDYLVVLCDSPVASVRAFGQEDLTKRWAFVDRTRALEQLCENPHSDMQTFLAGLLLDVVSIPPSASTFDRAVLRARGRARPAKELVKKRRAREAPSQPSTEDVAMLLEVARSRTLRDSEWALSRLATLAFAGEEIAGVTVDGAAGV